MCTYICVYTDIYIKSHDSVSRQVHA